MVRSDMLSGFTPVRFTPAWRKDADAPVYLLRAGSVRERLALEAELAGPLRAGKVWSFELEAEVRAGVELFLAGDPGLDGMLALLDQEHEVGARAIAATLAGKPDEAEAIADEISAADRQQLAGIRDVLAQHHAPYRDLRAQLERRKAMAPFEALRRFLVGIENGPDYARGLDGMVSEATIAAIDPFELEAVGNAAFGLLYGNLDKRPFALPSGSASARTSSKPAQSRAGGGSRKTPGRRTRA